MTVRTFSDERGPGTFHSLGVLPRRHTPVFHIHHDDDDEHSSSLNEHSASVPFPRSVSPPSSPPSSDPPSPRGQLSRGASAPILLPNGKPLKSSLKSSSSTTMIPPQTQAQHMHLRARSEPSTPLVSPKNVHFPEKDYGLATVRVYNRSARPAALSSPPNGNGDETETEGEDTPPIRFPFPPIPSVFIYEIDPTKSSSIPCKSSPPANLLLESLDLSSPSSSKPLLTGSILVRNLAFEKHIAVRFTLDDWQTVSEVGAHYAESVSSLPSHILSPSFASSTDPASQRGRGWDRFSFTIRLEDYAHSLSSRMLWLAVRYCTPSTYPEPDSSSYGPGGEWWDNNNGENYRIEFRPAVAPSTIPRGRPRRETVSAPISTSPALPHTPTTCKEHAMGLVVRSPPDTDKRSQPLRAGKLNLCNYAPPALRVAPCTSSPSTIQPGSSQSSTDDDSPASSTLSTPSVSPTITPRVMIGGHPATPTQPESEMEEDAGGPGHIADWDWSAPGKLRIDELRRHHPIIKPNSVTDSNALYNAFVSQWCFANDPSPGHHAYPDIGIMT